MVGRPPTRLAESAVAHLVAVLATIFALYPLLWVVSLALSSSGLGLETGAVPFPKHVSWSNFRTVMGTDNPQRSQLFWIQAANSIGVSVGTALLSLSVAAPAAYALQRLRFVGARAAVKILLATQLFPTVAAAVPLYFMLDRLGLLDSRAGLVLVYAATGVPFALFQLRAAFAAIPVELEEAAMVDGATRHQAFLRIVLPAARPALAVTALFTFMSAWNEFILAATLLSRERSFTLPVLLQRFVSEHDASWGAFAAGAILVSVPVVGIFYLAQRQFVAGLTGGAVKG
jgi:arabinogalactan oligomer/maltooligosaccharide transport system permease protein